MRGTVSLIVLFFFLPGTITAELGFVCRAPCQYPNRNLSIRVEERSRPPSNLAIRFLYQAGQTDIVAVDVATVSQFPLFFYLFSSPFLFQTSFNEN
jgi:hypothetical protein